MTYPVAVLPDLLVGWQKVADRYEMPVYVFQMGTHTTRSQMRPKVWGTSWTHWPLKRFPDSIAALLSTITSSQREEAFNLIEPGGLGWGEVEMPTRARRALWGAYAWHSYPAAPARQR